VIAWHVFVKTLRESARRPLYLATLLGIPVVLMVIFGAALPSDADSSTSDDAEKARASGPVSALPVLVDEPVITSITPLQQTITVITQRPAAPTAQTTQTSTATSAPTTAPTSTPSQPILDSWFGDWWGRSSGTSGGGWRG
jgi:hypothetical protein